MFSSARTLNTILTRFGNFGNYEKKEAYIIPPRENPMETLAFFNLKKKKDPSFNQSVILYG